MSPASFTAYQVPCEKRSTLKWKNMLPRRANSFILEWNTFNKEAKQFWQLPTMKVYQFSSSNATLNSSTENTNHSRKRYPQRSCQIRTCLIGLRPKSQKFQYKVILHYYTNLNLNKAGGLKFKKKIIRIPKKILSIELNLHENKASSYIQFFFFFRFYAPAIQRMVERAYSVTPVHPSVRLHLRWQLAICI